MIANYSIKLIIYVFMIHRETQTAKTIRDSLHGLLLMGGQQKWQVTKMFIYYGEVDGWWSNWVMEQPGN
jgi:hypothetical protein